MRLLKQNIHMNRTRGTVSVQVSFDEDFNLPETKSDMEAVAVSQGDAVIESIKLQNEKAMVKGKLLLEVLYASEGGGMENYSSQIPFEELVAFPGLEAGDYVQSQLFLEDMTVSLVNSRKLRMNALLTVTLKAENLYDEEAGNSLEDTGKMQTLSRELDVMQIAVQKKDTYRIREELELSANKPNIDRILWQKVCLRGLEFRPLDGKINVRGEAVLFIIYAGEEAHIPMQWLEQVIPFDGDITMPDCESTMVVSASGKIIHKEMEAKPDADGENRLIGVDIVLELDIRLYEEERIQILSDVYSPESEVKLQHGEAHFQELLIKNGAKCRVTDKMSIEHGDKVLQICSSDGVVQIDRAVPEKGGLLVEGAIAVNLLYMSSSDSSPLQSAKGQVPFSQLVEIPGMGEDCIWQMTPQLEQLSCIMLSGGEAEVRISFTLDTIAFRNLTVQTIIGITEEPLDPARLDQIPGIVGYIVKPGERLWDIAKRYYTTPEKIREANHLGNQELKGGERLLLLKSGEVL